MLFNVKDKIKKEVLKSEKRIFKFNEEERKKERRKQKKGLLTSS